MTEGAGLLNIPCRIVISIVSWSGPDVRMCNEGGMARFTTYATNTVNSDIKLWKASRTAGRIVGVTDLAHCQVCFGHRAMAVGVEKGAVQRMRYWSGRMTGSAVKGC